jgi:2-polyprenyl-3-methyl-5-hydroxy-6-metoxy-1,4-benzoquinol methylase
MGQGEGDMDAAQTYAERIDTVSTQRTRLHGGERQDDSWGGTYSRKISFRPPHRQLGANVETIASYVQPGDTVVDVGGGAGQVSLSLALRCRQVTNVDPSPGMKAEFEGAAVEAVITNAKFILSDWLEAAGLSGDLVATSNVSCFVRDIVTFIRKMDETANRRVIMTVWSCTPTQSKRSYIPTCLWRGARAGTRSQGVVTCAVGNGDSTRY